MASSSAVESRSSKAAWVNVVSSASSRADPHDEQNLAPASLRWPHRPQIMRPGYNLKGRSRPGPGVDGFDPRPEVEVECGGESGHHCGRDERRRGVDPELAQGHAARLKVSVRACDLRRGRPFDAAGLRRHQEVQLVEGQAVEEHRSVLEHRAPPLDLRGTAQLPVPDPEVRTLSGREADRAGRAAVRADRRVNPELGQTRDQRAGERPVQRVDVAGRARGPRQSRRRT